jgi:hypothetical protein
MSDLYDADTVVWSERQVELLDQIARGLRPNEAPDWANIIGEIGDAARSLIAAVTGYLRQSFIHDLKSDGWPRARDAEIWRTDAMRFRAEAADRFSASMRQRIDVEAIYQQALRMLPKQMDGSAPLPLRQTCPGTLDELLRDV